MKKFFIKTFFFTFFLLLFFVLVNSIYFGIIVSTDWDFRKRIESLKFINPDFELLVLGASTSLDGFDTELLTLKGVKSYNLALGGSTVRTNYIQLNEYLATYSKRPRYVVLGLNSVTAGAFDDNGIHPIVDITSEDHDYTLNDIPILRFKWLGFEFLKKIISSKHRKAKLSYGQLKFQKMIVDKTDYIESHLDTVKFKSSYWIGEIAQLCGQNGIEFLLIEMPGYKETQNLTEKGPFLLKFRNGYSANLYNFNSREFCNIFDANKDWIGNSHLNEYGAVKFTQKLFPLLRINDL